MAENSHVMGVPLSKLGAGGHSPTMMLQLPASPSTSGLSVDVRTLVHAVGIGSGRLSRDPELM